jgi:hypothetical protein
MRKLLKNFFIHRNGNYIIRRANDEGIKKLIAKLRPQKTELPLIRIGPNKDGGYILPDDLSDISGCFSPGVDQTSEFEFACYQRGLKIFLADKTVERPNLDLPDTEFDFLKKHIGITNDEETISLDAWINEKLPGKSDLLLQMDIEGAEYESLISVTQDTLNRFRIIIIEFHSLHEMWNPWFFKYASLAFEKILLNHICVHIHPNNCCGFLNNFGIEIPCIAEFTFIRKDRTTVQGFSDIFPHTLDFPNFNQPEITLPKIWQGRL